MQSLHQKLRAMRAAFAARSGDFPALARAFVNAYELQVQNANKRLANVETMLAEGRYDEADALMLDEPPLLELCDGLRQIEADKQGVLNVCKVGLKRVVDSKLLERVKSASAARTSAKKTAAPPPLPPSMRATSGDYATVARTHERTPKYLLPVSIGVGVFGVICLIVSLVLVTQRSSTDPAVLASLDLSTKESRTQTDINENSPEPSERAEGEENELDTELAPTTQADELSVHEASTTITSDIAEPRTEAEESGFQETARGTRQRDRSVLVGKIEAAKLLKGEVCVRLELEDFTQLPREDARFAHEKEGRSYRFEGSLIAEKRPQFVKNLECTTSPFILIVDVEPNDKELKELANTIRDRWVSISKTVVSWQNALRKSGFPRTQTLELLIEKPEEPKKHSSLSDVQMQLVAMSEQTEKIVLKMIDLEADRAKKSTQEEAHAHFLVYTDGLRKFQELLASLQRDLEELQNIDREFDTGTIMYIGRVEGGELVDATALQATYVIGQAN